ncbi:MAG: hypothetical protein PHG98_04670 [Bacteroidales bacterium]|nr:hypothetical protein [Bacteroidales bacterium]MDD4067823.1 hypothetical protein [Bacteroidales bacterium]MDD4739226.1 hypothetical protein [Bacteroidales bacterium]
MKSSILKFKHFSIAIVIIASLSILLFSSCEELERHHRSKILMLKVDYLTNHFEGGKELLFSQTSENFTIRTEYTPPGDFGNIKLIYEELNELIFDGDIIWMGLGHINYPQNILPASDFDHVLTCDYYIPRGGFENVFNPQNTDYDYSSIWSSVQGLVKVRDYLRSNPDASVKLFLYTPSVGVGNPEDWDWIIFLRN